MVHIDKHSKLYRNIAKYLTVLLLLTSCGNPKTEFKEYGQKLHSTDSLNVAVRITDFNKYGNFLDEIERIACSDSLTQILIDDDETELRIYPIVNCEPPMFNPRNRNTFYIYKDSIFKNYKRIQPTDLSLIMDLNYNNQNNKINFADDPNRILFIFKYYEKGKMENIEKHLRTIAKAYDKVETQDPLKIIFWPKIDLKPVFENDTLRYETVE